MKKRAIQPIAEDAERCGVDWSQVTETYRSVFCAGPGKRIHKRFSPTFDEAKNVYYELRRRFGARRAG
jgi:hypothetical protein